MTSKDHNRLLGIFFLIQGGLMLFVGLILGLVYGGIGAALFTSARKAEERTVGGVFLIVAIFVGIFVALFSVYFLVTGWKLYKEAAVGRILGIIASILCITSFPLGTALGVYGLWFFFGEQGKAFYEGGPPANPPPANSWM